VLGDAEAERRVAGLKPLRVEGPQVEVAWDEIPAQIASRLKR